MKNVTPMNDVTEDGRAARWQNHRTERRTELLTLARKAVHQLGPGASMEEIASHAQTSKPVYYRYFGDKEGLRRALGAMVITDFRHRVIDAALAKDDERAALRAMVGAYLELAQRSPNLYYFVTSGDLEATTSSEEESPSAALNAFFTEITALMTDRLSSYLHEAGSSDPHAVSLWPRAALGMVRAAGESWLSQPEGPNKPPLDELADALTTWLINGIAAATH
ncbi:TetR/AcrR family transcriptional regulator [Glutamicibacter sp. X7]